MPLPHLPHLLPHLLHCHFTQLDPLEGNVAFSAAQASWSFTLTSFAKMYAEVYGPVFDTAQLAKRLWGDYYFNEVCGLCGGGVLLLVVVRW